jgi:hypothetical protein
LFYGDGVGLSDLKIERRPSNDVSGSYIVTVEGVDVFGDEVPVGTSWLFSRQALQRILYAKLDTPDMYVGIDFELREGEKVELRLGFSQQFIWSEKPIFEISGPDPNETGEAIEP